MYYFPVKNKIYQAMLVLISPHLRKPINKHQTTFTRVIVLNPIYTNCEIYTLVGTHSYILLK